MIDAIINCLTAITHPRFYETERGYQGEFLANLRAALPGAGLPGDVIVEQEYQKRLREHGIRARPDIIVHIPTGAGSDRRRGNFAVFELKLAAQAHDARADFFSLDDVFEALDYSMGVFINIATRETHADLYTGRFPDRIHCFAAQLDHERVQVKHAHFNGTHLLSEDFQM